MLADGSVNVELNITIVDGDSWTEATKNEIKRIAAETEERMLDVIGEQLFKDLSKSTVWNSIKQGY